LQSRFALQAGRSAQGRIRGEEIDPRRRGHGDRVMRPLKVLVATGPGPPPIPAETRVVLVRMATENGSRARKIQAESCQSSESISA
jgi:hypothetical protein